MNAQLQFYGAVREVTGSMHLVEIDGHMVAMDCGLFQGKRSEANTKNRTFPYDPKKINTVILSHAHIDHCGRLPRLVREGFSGPVYATPATCDLARIMLADSAHIQEEDTEYWNKKRVRRGDAAIEPLYNADDVAATVKLLQPQRLGEIFDVVPGMRATLHEAGHMLGSAGIGLEIANGADRPVRIVYTGDLGRPNMEILRDPVPLPPCDYLICESTYGGRETPDAENMRDQLAEVINKTIERGGKVIIPSFAVGRTQVIVYDFHLLVLEGRIPEHVPLIVDSPLAVRATEIFKDHPEIYDREAFAFNKLTGDMLECDKCEYIQDVAQSKALHGRDEPMIIISASGMCEVGRILHHLKNNIEDPRNTVLIVGYQAAHTLGRRLVEKSKQVRIFGEMYKVRAKVKALNGFSAHADAAELTEMTAPLAGEVRKVFLVHGELDQAQALAEVMRKNGFTDVIIPDSGDKIPIY
ncbi:MAG: MBL fold metallo-hydrolase [Planctomycetota bacterium]|nr:MAG: MBL fold metallo-hydrolase [Planctomycetota bacterium]